MTTVRVRFAPSPTGTLHIGSARSALSNWLYARHFGADGTYVLRIEDTDQQRSTPENVVQALRVFRWLGLDWDEGPDVGGPHGPYFQSERGEQYTAALDLLRAAADGDGHPHVYECYCTAEELTADREAAQAAKRPVVYAGRCRDLTDVQRQAHRDAGRSHVVRFRVPDAGATVVRDLIHGDLTFDNALLGDFVVARGDGSVLYNFANVVDDAAMQITHVIRGDDHISNTPRQVLLYAALGHDVPLFAHLPMVHGPDGGKLSKRKHHTSSVEQLATDGYLPAAVRNGLALLGWARDGETTVMSTDELTKSFDVARVKKSPARLDYEKLQSINGDHLRGLSPEAWAEAFADWRNEWVGADDDVHTAAHAAEPAEAALLVQQKADTLRYAAGLLAFLIEPFVMTDEAWTKLEAVEEAPRVLGAAIEALTALGNDFSVASVEAAVRGLPATLELKPKFIFGPIRFAVTGRTISPGLFESIHVLGAERALDRLTAARERLAVPR